MPRQRLSHRQLNRATLARQLLLQRSEMDIVEAVTLLIGLQGQVSEGPYQGLWSRLAKFEHPALTARIVDKSLLRATTMRGTLHLHTPSDLLGLRELLQPVLDRMWQGNFRKRFGDADPLDVLASAREIIDGGPITAGALGKALKPRFPGVDPLAMTVLLQVKDILIQVPPTRIWGSGHSPLLVRAHRWLETLPSPSLEIGTLARRYLRAYGPASVADMQSWCGLTRLAEVIESLRDELVSFEDPDGRELFDLPEAPRPDGDVPAPPRFLPLFDNVYLGFDNRDRLFADGDDKGLNFLAELKPVVLVDGVVAATWRVVTGKRSARLEIEPLDQLARPDRTALADEGESFVRFMADDAEQYEVAILPPK